MYVISGSMCSMNVRVIRYVFIGQRSGQRSPEPKGTRERNVIGKASVYTMFVCFWIECLSTSSFFLQIVQTYRSLKKDESFCDHFHLSVKVEGEISVCKYPPF